MISFYYIIVNILKAKTSHLAEVFGTDIFKTMFQSEKARTITTYADAYEREDLKDKALEQYGAAVEIDPRNTGAQKKIQELQ